MCDIFRRLNGIPEYIKALSWSDLPAGRQVLSQSPLSGIQDKSFVADGDRPR